MGQVQPTGRVNRDVRGLELIVSRRIPVPAAEAWAWVTGSGAREAVVRELPRITEAGSAVLGEAPRRGGPPARADACVLECTPGERYVVETGRAPTTSGTSRVSVADLGGAQHGLPGAPAELGARGRQHRPRLGVLPRPPARRARWRHDARASTTTSRRSSPYYERLAMDGDPVAWPASWLPVGWGGQLRRRKRHIRDPAIDPLGHRQRRPGRCPWPRRSHPRSPCRRRA